MMHNDGMSQLDLLVKRFSPPLLEVSRDSQEEPKLAPGERVQAHVLASMPNGRFQVLIKNQVLDMNLPSNTQAGEQLDLSVVKNQPRLTFAFTSDLQRALPALAPEVKLSDAVKYLGALLSKVEDMSANKMPTVQVLDTPLIAAADGTVNTGKLEGGLANELAKVQVLDTSRIAASDKMLDSGKVEDVLDNKISRGHALDVLRIAAFDEAVDTSKLAHNLQQSLSQSGVFFESHQAEWVVGQRSLSQLLQEPQARMGQAPLVNLEENTQAKQAGSQSNSLQTSTGVEQESLTVLNTAEQVTRTFSERAASSLAPFEQQQLRELVQQQLNVLDTRQLTWMGLAWPGQPMEWLVQERQGDPATGEEQTPVWHSRLKLDMPNLGEVVAAISLQPGGLQIHFQSNPETARLLQAQKPRLFEQLAAAGLNLLGASVNDEQ